MTRKSTLNIAVTILVYLLIGNANSEFKKIEGQAYKEGDEFVLTAYNDSPSVYVRIDSVNNHPFLEIYYDLSFHGVCFRNIMFSNSDSVSQGLFNVQISPDGFKRSIVSTPVDKERSLKCTDSLAEDSEEVKRSILLGGAGVRLSPLDSKLGVTQSQSVIKIIHN